MHTLAWGIRIVLWILRQQLHSRDGATGAFGVHICKCAAAVYGKVEASRRGSHRVATELPQWIYMLLLAATRTSTTESEYSTVALQRCVWGLVYLLGTQLLLLVCRRRTDDWRNVVRSPIATLPQSTGHQENIQKTYGALL